MQKPRRALLMAAAAGIAGALTRPLRLTALQTPQPLPSPNAPRNPNAPAGMDGPEIIKSSKAPPNPINQMQIAALVQQLTWAVFEGLHIAVACRGETYQGRIDPCLDHAIQTRQIAHRGRAENYAADHSPSWRRTSSRGTSSPGSIRARSSLAAVSASMISCSPSSARKEMATCTSVSGRASTSD